MLLHTVPRRSQSKLHIVGRSVPEFGQLLHYSRLLGFNIVLEILCTELGLPSGHGLLCCGLHVLLVFLLFSILVLLFVWKPKPKTRTKASGISNAYAEKEKGKKPEMQSVDGSGALYWSLLKILDACFSTEGIVRAAWTTSKTPALTRAL